MGAVEPSFRPTPVESVTANGRLGWKAWARSFLAWAIAGVFFTAVLAFTHVSSGQLQELVVQGAVVWGLFAVLTPPVFGFHAWLWRRPRALSRRAAGIVVAGTVFIGLHFAGSTALGAPTSPAWSFSVYALLIILARGIGHRRMAHRRALEAERLQRQLDEARTLALQVQLQPHFLFNTLHAIAAAVDDEPREARAMIAALGDLLRSTMRQNEPVIALQDDIELLAPYLKLQRIRFGPRLDVRIDVPEALRSQPVPTLLLQPLVENAILHGIEPSSAGGRVEIAAVRTGDCVEITVSDDGRGVRESPDEGTGMRSVRERLVTLFGERASITMAPRDPRGTTVRVVVPVG